MGVLGSSHHLGLHGKLSKLFRDEKCIQLFQVQTIANAVRLGMSICARNGTASLDDILVEYSEANLVLSDSVEEIYQRFNDDECDILATELSVWVIQRQKQEVNADCDWFWNGIVQLARKGGIAMRVESFCSGIISQSVDLHMREMVREGAIVTIMEKYASLVFGA